MDLFTKALWSVIEDDEELLKELTAIMRQEHKPFLTFEQAFEANTHILKANILERFHKWLDWLPTLPIDQIGLALAEEAIEFVEWEKIAKQLLQLVSK
jgi:hypothetical protein